MNHTHAIVLSSRHVLLCCGRGRLVLSWNKFLLTVRRVEWPGSASATTSNRETVRALDMPAAVVYDNDIQNTYASRTRQRRYFVNICELTRNRVGTNLGAATARPRGSERNHVASCQMVSVVVDICQRSILQKFTTNCYCFLHWMNYWCELLLIKY